MNDQPNNTSLPENRLFDANKSLNVVGGRRQLAIKMFELLIGSLESDLHDISTAAEKNDIKTLHSSIHKLHGATLYCGVPQLTSHLAQLEHLINNQATVGMLKSATMDVINSINQLLDWISTHNWQQMINESSINNT